VPDATIQSLLRTTSFGVPTPIVAITENVEGPSTVPYAAVVVVDDLSAAPNSVAAGEQRRPDLAVDDSGRFVVNTDSAGQQYSPSVGMRGDGAFAVSWQDDKDKISRTDERVYGSVWLGQ